MLRLLNSSCSRCSKNRDHVDHFLVNINKLRHSYLTSLARAGVHPKVMQELAGHANSAITMEIYTHTDMNEKFAAAEAWEKAMG